MKVKLPMGSIILMIVFVVVISIACALPMPQGPANIDWGVWIVAYLSYGYLVLATLYHVKTGK